MATSNNRRVICIDDNWTTSDGKTNRTVAPKKDEICTVVGVWNFLPNIPHYRLQGYEPHWWFKSTHFRELDDFGDRICTVIEQEINSPQPQLT